MLLLFSKSQRQLFFVFLILVNQRLTRLCYVEFPFLVFSTFFVLQCGKKSIMNLNNNKKKDREREKQRKKDNETLKWRTRRERRKKAKDLLENLIIKSHLSWFQLEIILQSGSGQTTRPQTFFCGICFLLYPLISSIKKSTGTKCISTISCRNRKPAFFVLF